MCCLLIGIVQTIDFGRYLLRSRSGHFFVVVFLLNIFELKINISVFFSAEATLLLVYWYVLAIGKHALRWMAYLPNRTSVVIAVYLGRKAYVHGNLFFVLLPDRFDALFNPKSVSETNAIKYHPAICWPAWKTHEFSRHRCCLTLNFGDNANYSYSHRFKPLTDPRVS